MNGISSSENGSVIDRRPIVTCAGEIEVFSVIEDNLSEALPKDTSEWRRSLGRPVRSVHIGASFIPYSPLCIPKSSQWDLIRQPLFHIYWTECSDVDIYKTTIKEDVENWLRELNSRDISDWLIVVVENFDGKRSNKLLPRTTVLDKIRADFAPKQGDRCISVINPGKTESRFADSWRGLVSRVRHLLLVAYARAVSRLEDHVRLQRERRNEIGWDFMQYFHLQEELAQVLEMLGLYDEALVQYDELDALFSQFVVNGVTSECVSWLSNFQKPLERWHGLKLGPSTLFDNPSLLELRAYLFAKQAHMLLLTSKVWEMAARCLPFLHTCTRELSVLEVTSPPGAVSCWLFLAAMEVLQTCDKFNHADEVEEYSLHTAALWEYASQKICRLGEQCGLMPGGSPTSEQLHIVVELSAGMGDNPGPPNHPSPTDKLKEALCSQEAFKKTYLELAELAMGTYKHVGRLRSARLVGKELASFYLLLGETQKAAAFLGDALRTFEKDGWKELVAHAHLDLAICYKKAEDYRKLVSACAYVSAALEIDTLIRWTYFDEMRKCLQKLKEPLVVPLNELSPGQGSVKRSWETPERQAARKLFSSHIEKGTIPLTAEIAEAVGDCDELKRRTVPQIKLWLLNLKSRKSIMKIASVYIKNDGIIMQDTNIDVELTLESNFPREIVCTKLLLSLEQDTTKDHRKTAEKYFAGRLLTSKDMKPKDPALQRLRIKRNLDYKQDKQLASAGIAAKFTELKRKDSVPAQSQADFSYCLEVNKLPTVLTPGTNCIRLRKHASRVGKYRLKQVAVHMENLHLVSSPITPCLTLEVEEEGPTLKLYKRAAPLLAGIEQTMDLILTLGSYSIDPSLKIKLSASVGLELRVEPDLPLSNTLEVTVGPNFPFSSTRRHLYVLADTLSKDHQVTMHCPWLQKPLVVTLNFSPPLVTSWRLHTVQGRKFVQVMVTGRCECNLLVQEASLKTNALPDVEVVDRNCESSQIITNGLNYSYIWEVIANNVCDNLRTIKSEFSVKYKLDDNDDNKLYQYFFDINDYQTLYILDAIVEPAKGSEFCRSGAVCQLHLSIHPTKYSQGSPASVMYEVLAEQSVWAVCGRTAGVVTFTGELEKEETVSLDVMPLTSGHLPLPLVRISRYIPAESGTDKPHKADTHPRLEPFSSGQVYNKSKGKQLHVIATMTNESFQ